MYAVGSLCTRLAGAAGFTLASYVFVALAGAALWLLHDSLRYVVKAPQARLSALALVAFLPVSVVTTVVYAADALALFPFVLAGWSLLRCLSDPAPRARISAALLCGLALCLGNVAKATFMTLPLGVAVILLLQVRRRALEPGAAARVALVVVAIPLAFGLWLSSQARAAEASSPARHSFDWKGTGEMTLSSLLIPKPGDLRILGAPTYFPTPDPNSGKRTLVTTDNALSYPALMQLGIFTDVMNLAGNNVVNRTSRPGRQAMASRFCAAWGLAIAVPALVALAGLAAATVTGAFTPARLPGMGVVVWLVLGATWYLPLVAILPFVHHAYEWGYWLPRLVLPAVWAFLIVAVGAVEARAEGPSKRRVLLALTVTVSIQCAASLASIWY